MGNCESSKLMNREGYALRMKKGVGPAAANRGTAAPCRWQHQSRTAGTSVAVYTDNALEFTWGESTRTFIVRRAQIEHNRYT